MAEIIDRYNKPGKRAPFVRFKCDVCGEISERQASRFNIKATKHVCGKECRAELHLRPQPVSEQMAWTPFEMRLGELARVQW